MFKSDSEARANTREKFNEVLKKYSHSDREGSIKKRERKETFELQDLKKNRNPDKVTEDEKVLHKEYDPMQGSSVYLRNTSGETEVLENVSLSNFKNKDGIRSSKSKKKSKRDLPPLHPSDSASSHSQDTVKSFPHFHSCESSSNHSKIDVNSIPPHRLSGSISGHNQDNVNSIPPRRLSESISGRNQDMVNSIPPRRLSEGISGHNQDIVNSIPLRRPSESTSSHNQDVVNIIPPRRLTGSISGRNQDMVNSIPPRRLSESISGRNQDMVNSIPPRRLSESISGHNQDIVNSIPPRRPFESTSSHNQDIVNSIPLRRLSGTISGPNQDMVNSIPPRRLSGITSDHNQDTVNSFPHSHKSESTSNHSKINVNSFPPRRLSGITSGHSQDQVNSIPSFHLPESAHSQDNSSGIHMDPCDSNSLKRPKQRSKKVKSKATTELISESHVEDIEDNLLHKYQQQIAQEEDKKLKKTRVREEEKNLSSNVPLINDLVKKKKKKLKSVTIDAGEQDANVHREVYEESHKEPEGKKKKSKKKHIIQEETQNETETPEKPMIDENLVLGVFIHRSDHLETQLLISHPMVKIHIVDEHTGQYVKKEDSHRHVSSFYEEDKVDHILPIMTQPFDFKKNKSIIPEWQEQIIFNERFGYFIRENNVGPNVLLFFEILDFMTMEEARANVEAEEHERGFTKIAWAFLKLVGTNDFLNINNKLRLQLFYPLPRVKRQPKTVEVFEWWRKYPRTKYPSTLFVTVKGIKIPEHVDPSIRSMMALQEERGSTSYSELQMEISRKSLLQPHENKAMSVTWTRLPGQVCRIPNKPILSFRGGQMGCFTVSFSNAGTYLAAACADKVAFPVVVYEIPSGKVLAAFSGHLKIVYELCWSKDDCKLLSASSDGTVREWNVEKLNGTAQKVLTHPSFVYCAKYHPSVQNLVVTGSFDCLIRVWNLDVDNLNGQLLQDFEEHSGFVNTICFDFEGKRLFSGDSMGVINVWKSAVAGGKHRRNPCHQWCIEKKIAEAELKGVSINMLQLHPNGRCLLIHAKDSLLRMMDLRILSTKKYTGATNYSERIYSTITPCGTYIFSGSEDGMAYVWNADTGDQIAVYSEFCYSFALTGVSFHPYEHMVAFSAFGLSQPVHVYMYDRKAFQLDPPCDKPGSRSTSLDTRTVRNTPDLAVLQDPPASLASDQFASTARLAMRMQSVKERLDSVLEPPSKSSAFGFSYQEKMPPSLTRQSDSSDVGTLGVDASLPPPGLLSPHCKLRIPSSVTEHLIPKAALSTQKRGFSPVRQLSKRTPSFKLPPPSTDDVPSDIPVAANPFPVQQIVIGISDYTATRSDELTFQRGDIIQVLYKDSDTWWFGRLVGGLQGYFPAANVVDQTELTEDTKGTLGALSEKPDGRTTPKRVSAVISVTGELHFLSEPTLSDTEPEQADAKSKRKKKVKKTGVPATSRQASFTEVDFSKSPRSRRRGRSTDRPLPKMQTGRSNSATGRGT